MRFTSYINNFKCQEWDINPSQGALVDLFNQLSSWAIAETIDGKTYYHIARQKVIEELPLWFKTRDNVYRNIKHLVELSIVEYIKLGNRDMVRLTDKGNTWNSENSPSLGNNSELDTPELGNDSESNSEKNPTYNTTEKNNTTKKNKLKKIYKENFPEFEKYIEHFSDFYVDEILISLEDDPQSPYHKIAEILYGANESQLIYDNVLSMEQQFSYQDFINISKWKINNYKNFSFTDYLFRMNNRVDLTKKNRRVKDTMVNWINNKENRN